MCAPSTVVARVFIGACLAFGLAASPALATDGTGTAVVSPTYVVSGSTGNFLTFTYTAGGSGMSNGNLTLSVPSGWTAPGNGFSNGGIGGTCPGDANNGASENGQLVTISGLTLGAGQTCTIDYGIQNFNGGDTAPTLPSNQTSRNDTFTIQEQTSGSSGGLVALTAGSPVVTVGDDGTGTIQVAPAHVLASSTGNTLTFTYHAAAAMSSGELTIAVPAGWSAPSTTASAAGATTSTCGTVGVTGSTIKVTGVTLAASATCTVTYGNKASGPGATAPTTGGPTPSTFTTQQEATNDNNLIALASSPGVSVTAGDGAGTNTVAPNQVIQGSTGNDLTFTYTVPAGGMSNGTLTLLIPNGWTPPGNGFSNGGIGGTCPGDANNGASESGQLVTISGLSLNGGTTCTIDYGISGFNGGDTAPSTEGAYTFTTQEASTATGTLTNIAVQPVVNVGSDGTGTMQVAPTHVVASSTGNTVTFTYQAATTVSSGEVTVDVPQGWSAPSTTASAAGATTSTCGTVGVSGSTIQVTGVSLATNGTCTITYGNKASGPGATAPASGGPTPTTFTSQEKSSSGGTLTTLSNGSPQVTVTALDGTGTNTVTPTTVITSSTGNDLTFTYTAAAGGMSNGKLTLLVPTGWTAPSNGFNAGGIGGTCPGDASNGASESGQLVTISGLSLTGGASCTIDYGIQNFNSGVTAPSSNGQYTFTTQEASTATGTLTDISSQPVVTVGNDGTGTMHVAPTAAVASSTGNTLVFTYQAATTVSSGELTVDVPQGWSTPSTTASAAGATTSTCGTVGVSGSTIQVSGVSLATNGTCTITYGSKASGPGATAPASGGGGAPYTFNVQEKSSSAGTLTALGNGSPQVIVTAPDGGGTMSVTPATAINGSTGNDFDFKYTAPAGGMNNGELTLLVPTGWTTPSASANSAGGVSATCTNNAVQISSVGGGSLITVTGVTLDGGAMCDIRYGLQNFNSGVTAPAGTGDYVFTAKEASTSTGTLTNLGSSPDVNVSSDGSGTLSVSPLTQSAGASGKTLTFTYTSGVSLSNGEVAVAIPAGWSVPSTTGTDAGFTSTDCGGGSVHVSAGTIHVTGITMGASQSCSITYGAKTSGGPGATVTSSAGVAQFPVQERSSNTGSLTDLATSPSLTVYGADGTGTLTVDPSFAGAGSGGNTLTFTYTSVNGGISGGQLVIAVPAGWSAPSTTPQVAGYTTSTCGSVTITGGAIHITGISLSGATTCTIKYGDTGSGGTGATAPASSGVGSFSAQEASTVSDTPTSLASSPQVTVTAADGSGAMTVAPTGAITGSSGNTLTFTYTAATGGTHGGELTLDVPAGWSAPSTTATDAGSTTSGCGSVGITGTTIQVTGVTLPGGGTCAIVYGSRAGGGPGATATSVSTASSFTTKEMSTAAGLLTALSSSPSVTTSPARTLMVTVKGKGHVTGNGISCPGTCAKSYPSGTVMSLAAKPASGFRFSGWSGACTGKALCKFTITSNAAVTATFAALPVCTVPNVKGDTLSTAEQKIRAAHCAVGKVTKPANSAGQQLVVGSTSPAAGTKHPAGTKVAIALVRRRRR